MRRTRKAKKQKGGNVIITDTDRERVRAVFNDMPESLQGQVIHCMSQLIRFHPCLSQSNRRDQFFFNLGRLKELLGETKNTRIWWAPFDDGADISMNYLEQMRELIQEGLPLEAFKPC
jgi:hypothetical protein